MRRPRGRRAPHGPAALGLLTVVLFLVACGPSAPDATPYPTTAPTATPAEGRAVVESFLAAWADADYAAMYALLAPADRLAYPEATFTGLYQSLGDLARVTSTKMTTGAPVLGAIAPEPRPPDLPPPGSSSPAPGASGALASAPTPSIDTTTVLDGPVPALAVPFAARLYTDRFDVVRLDRTAYLTQGAGGWQMRWTPSLVFPELGDGGTLAVERQLSTRGRIVGTDGTVWAAEIDGVRSYPQEWLAGQAIGYVSAVTADDLTTLAAKGYQAGDVVGRSGLEYGAEDLLRGTPGWTLNAVSADGAPTPVLHVVMVPGAEVMITLRPGLQSTAERGLANHNNGASAVVDPTSGDVWALASAPAFNPNAMVRGTTMGGAPLAKPTSAQIVDKAVLGAYPAGSSFKPFTLAAALKTGVAGPGSRVACPGTWTYNGFTFHNYKDHTLGNNVSLLEAMAFSCNTTYMPLSIRVMEASPTALTDIVAEFGFGRFTGIRHLVEESGILPDAAYFAEHPRGDGTIHEYNGFDQVQLAIGQGSYTGTMLQLANAYAAIGNGGTLWTPRIVVSATLPDGTVAERVDSKVTRTISLTPAQLGYVTQALEAVVNLPYGTGTAAFAGFGIQVAGKSGTAETGTPDPHALFPAFAPAANPRIAVATILLYVPLGTGGSDSAPLVRQVMARYFSGG
jgi:penicillin-binding protein 2